MRKLWFLASLATARLIAAVQIGDSYEQVIVAKGAPTGTMQVGNQHRAELAHHQPDSETVSSAGCA